MKELPYTFEDMTQFVAYGKRRGFMAGIVFTVIVQAYIRKMREMEMLSKRPPTPPGPY